MMQGTATLIDGKIYVRTTSSGSADFERAKAACKAVFGGRWDAAQKAWRYPASVETCHALRRVFGTALTVAPPLREWYREQAPKADAHADLSRATDATLTRLPGVAPRLSEALRADQRVGTAWLAEGYRGAGLVADQPGCGKTLVTIAGVLESGDTGPILVACPRLSVKAVWFHELRRWTDERVYIARGTRAKRQRAIDRFMADPAERKWLIVVGEMLRVKEAPDPETGKDKIVGEEYPALFGVDWSWVIVDESHKMFGSLTVVRGNRTGKGLKRLKAGRRVAISGTPFGKGGRLQGMFGTLHWLWPDEFTSFWRWTDTYFEVIEEQIFIPGGGGRTRPTRKIGPLRAGTEEEFLRSFGPRILRRTKAEVLPWLPPKQYVELWCEPSPAQVKQYKSLVDDGEIISGEAVITADGVLAAITRAKQLANGAVTVDPATGQVQFTDDSAKIDQFIERLDTRGILDGSGDMKVIAASQFNEFLVAVGRRLQKEGVEYHLMTGSTSDTKRDRLMQEFQGEGGKRVFLLNAKAGGVSVTLDAADELHMLDELWDPGDNEQVEDRVHRASRNHQVVIYQYRTEGTIDEAIASDVEGRRFEQFKILDGRRGRDYVRDLVTFRKSKEDEE